MINPLNFLSIQDHPIDQVGLLRQTGGDHSVWRFHPIYSYDAVKEALVKNPDLDGVLLWLDSNPTGEFIGQVLADLASDGLPLIITTRNYRIDDAIAWMNQGVYRYIPQDRPELIRACLVKAASDHRDWNARKNEEKTLRENEALYRQLVEIYPESIAVTDLEGTFVKVNQETLRFYGFDRPEQMLGKNYLDFVAPEDRQKAIENAGVTFDKGKSESLLTMLLPGGGRSYFEFSSAVMIEESGSNKWFIGAGRDVTERIEKDKALQALKDRFSSIFHLSPVATFILTLHEYLIIDGNESLLKLVGLEREEIVGRKAVELDLPLLEHGLSDLIEVAKAKGAVREVERSIPRRNREMLRVLVSIELMELDEGPCALVMLMDITERKRGEEEIQRMNDELELRVAERTGQLEVSNARLRESEERYRSLAEASQDFIFVISEDNRVLYVNSCACRILGKSYEEIIGQPIHNLFSRDTAIRQMNSIIRVKNAGQPDYVEDLTAFTPDNVRWLGTWLIPMRGKDGIFTSVLGVSRDITEMKQAEQELKRALEKEKELNMLKSEFVSRTSHEFRTPLSTILSSAELLEHYGSEWPRLKVNLHLHRIQSTALELAEILDDILLVEKVEAGKLKVHLTMVDLQEFFEHMIEEQQLRDQHRHPIKFAFNCDEPSHALIDEKLLHQITYNLLSNAIKYSGRGMPIEVSLICNQDGVRFDISDHGIGISEDDQRHLFERFYRSDSVSHLPGSGLGLTIVKDAVELMRGSIRVESELGSGTKFSVTIPSSEPEAAERP